jgi:transcriptional regulator GlxA family with amidase domain
MRQAGEPGSPARDGRAGAAPLRRIGFLLLPEFTLIAFTAAVEALRMANRLSGKRLYEWQVLSVTGGPVHASNGLVFTADTALAMADALDLVLVCGGERVEQYTDRTLLAGLRRLALAVPRLGALCTGSHALARAGLLDGYRCTIHWENLASFRERFPAAICSQELLEIDRDRYTCSGGTAPLDLMLNIVQRDHGAALATAISEEFLCERIRGRHDRQRIPLRLTLGTSQPKLMETVALMEANLEEPMSLDELSAAVGLSRRQLERLFQKYLKCAPTRYYLDLRLHKARQLLLQTDMSVVDVALACGFVSAPHFSKCYRDYFAKPPRDERRRKEAEVVDGRR